MANRKFGNYSSFNSRNSQNRNNFNQGPSSNISPWQVGANPAGDNTQNIQNQLALALTNIIQSAQSNASKGPPSLFSLNTSPGFLKPNRFNNNNNQNSFSNKREFKQRSEPYYSNNSNKNRMSGWRSDSVSNNKGQSNYNSSKRGSFSRESNRSNQRSNSRENFKKPNDISPSKQDKASSSDHGSSKNENETKPKDHESSSKSLCKYKDIPKGLLHCFICNKSMWDGESFQNHVGGKAHKQMFNSLEESFQITVNILRENMRLTEERKMIEFERVQRSRKQHHNNPNEPESHCNMCDLKFFGRIVLHRQSESHQRLKRFLHPKCLKCDLEFTSRMEWVEHLFQPDHLQKMRTYLDGKGLDHGEYRASIVLDIETEPLLQEHIQNEDDHPVLELDEDLTNLFNRIPVYKPKREVAKNSLKPATGFICEICKLFMANEEDSQKHLKSHKHYVKFVDTVKTKYQSNANEKTEDDDNAVKEEKNTEEIDDNDANDGSVEGGEVKKPTESDHGSDSEYKDYDRNNEDEMNKLLDDIYMDPELADETYDPEKLDEEDEEEEAEESKPSTPTARLTRNSLAKNKEQEQLAKKPRLN